LAPLTLKLFHHGWYNPVTHFVFFATGGLVALLLHSRTWRMPAAMRFPLFLTGMLSFAGVRFVNWNESVVYFVMDLGCVLVFFAVLGLERRYLPFQALYLGKISYGLYVFHAAVYVLITPKLLEALHLRSELVSLALTYGLTLVLTAGIAAVSYAFFETPFLSLKKRFEFVRSRPV
jgi:peptidoglycan/LPS O-acetylase OafA/YrhL